MAAQGCPGGHLGDAAWRCRCSPALVEHYRVRLSGPLLDRIDMHLQVPALPFSDFAGDSAAEPSARIRARVEAARVRQRERFRAPGGPPANAYLSPRDLRRHCQQSPELAELLGAAVERLGLSARGCHRVLKVARTIADLAGKEQLEPAHVREAIQYRSLD